ncbi:beta-1,4-galactosyltransferase 1 isoform X1 [Brachyistius frenatus]|uniref:beta-1,4-galactosyltransferase 1 isoform X1 n=1 Tax=Brachyistius frenatus TaxID=100188 RepID=UPI0037E8A465
MPGDSTGNFNLLHRTCKLVVLLCFLHISVTVVFYVRSLDIRFAFVQNQQSHNTSTQPNRDRSTALPPRTEPKQADPKKEVAGLQEPAAPQAEKKLEKCPETSPLLVGPLRVEFNIPVSLEQIKKDNPSVRPGGRFRPVDCEALQKVAIIIPFRKRDEHLKFWLHYLHPVLQRQQLDYGVYVINQFFLTASLTAPPPIPSIPPTPPCMSGISDQWLWSLETLRPAPYLVTLEGDATFNRAKLLNVGYAEALKDYDYGCFVFSDVDLIPMDDRNTYRCFSQPRHLSVSMDKFGFRLPYNQYFGGVSSMSKEHFLKINGFPNNYWGWGGEDDDIYNRLASKGMSISRPSGDVGKCRMIRHDRDKKNEPNPQRFDRIAHTRETMHKDGINSLIYRVVSAEKFDLFTKISVDVGKP